MKLFLISNKIKMKTKFKTYLKHLFLLLNIEIIFVFTLFKKNIFWRIIRLVCFNYEIP